ncbi:MAG: FlgD immunoglobulin-like domain containing protein [Thermodesulfobacteriota bacterium]
MSSVSESLGNITSYTDPMADKKAKDEELGMQDFLTMLIAQLQHQDPMNPMESQDFTAQLTQFSQLEAQFDANEKLDSISGSLSSQAGRTGEDYLDKHITANVDTIDVTDSKASGGFYTLEETAEVKVTIFDQNGKEIKTLEPGQKDAGSYPVEWDGTNDSGDKVNDGTYKFSVEALTESGYSPVNTTVEGTAESIMYQGEKEYLVVKGVLVSPDSVVEVKSEESESFEPGSTFNYLGKNINAEKGLISVKKGEVETSLPSFIPEKDATARINVLNSKGQIVHSYYNGNLKAGEEEAVEWDGKDLQGNKVEDGYYSYEVVTPGNTEVDTSISGEAGGVYYENGRHYIDIDGVRVAPEDIKSIDG